jgi:hypothetical protein
VIDYYDLMEYLERENDGMAEYYIEDWKRKGGKSYEVF